MVLWQVCPLKIYLVMEPHWDPNISGNEPYRALKMKIQEKKRKEKKRKKRKEKKEKKEKKRKEKVKTQNIKGC